MLNRQPGLTCPQAKPTASAPAFSKAWITPQRSIDHPRGGANVLAEISEYDRGVGKDIRVAGGIASSLLCKIDCFAAVRLLVFGPTVEIQLAMAECRNSKCRPVTRITLHRLAEQIERGQCASFFPSVCMRTGAQVEVVGGQIIGRTAHGTTDLGGLQGRLNHAGDA